ncbi:MAG: hypothetical protein H7263_01095 [Candidatus Sericytochromatia bacterium]|nr:hypothetical protein [Candidatus Sericytochromatia bacterium]
MTFINIRPTMYEGLLNVFDLLHDKDHIGYHVKDYKGEKITPQMLVEEMDYPLFGLLSVCVNVPKLVEKMNFHMVEQKGNNFLVFKLAAFLGLPGENLGELQELKELLTWIKDEAIKNPTENVKLCLDRCGQEITFGIISTSVELKEQLQKQFEDKIIASLALKQWVDNLKTGFKEIGKKYLYLSSTLDSLNIMGMKEQMDLVGERPAPQGFSKLC